MLTCQFENGHQFHFRHVTASAIILNKEKNQILLAKRSEKTYDEQGKYCTPGGYLDRDETIISGLLREIFEETGYKTKVDYLLLIVDSPNRKATDRQNVEFVFVAEALKKVAEPHWETSEIKWFPLDNLPKEQEFAFDHKEFIDLYLKHLKNPFKLPFFKSS